MSDFLDNIIDDETMQSLRKLSSRECRVRVGIGAMAGGAIGWEIGAALGAGATVATAGAAVPTVPALAGAGAVVGGFMGALKGFDTCK